MSDKGTVFQKGGGGTNYEQAVGTAFTVTMLINGNVPCLPVDAKIIEISFQTTNKGYETDDILVIAKSKSIQHRLLIQAKNNLTFSCKNEIFKQVITAFWNDYNKPDIFNKHTDKLLIIKSGLDNIERNHIKLLLNIAKTHPIEKDFFSEINRINILKEKFSIFMDTLKDINKTITESNVLEFIKHIDVFDYDFSSEPSRDKINFFNMIKLSKSKTTFLDEEEIWNSILAFVSHLNQTGGSITIESLRENKIYSYFNLENIIPCYSYITKLLDDSNIFMNVFKNNINGYHIPREKYYEKIINALQKNQIIFITGEPGVGKSAIAKDFLYKSFGENKVFSFRAEQFNVIHLATLLSNQGMNVSVHELLSCIALMESKIIFIDGMEKLLEGEALNAFQQLKNILIEYPELKIIITTRRFSIELLCEKFDIKPENAGFVVIDQLSKEEIEKISEEFPKLKPVLKNKKIETLLSSPKYMEFALTALIKADEDLTSVNMFEFKTLLWNRLVKNDLDRRDGLSQKREDAFIEIAVKRAKSMRISVRPVDADPLAIDLLENDDIIIQNNDSSGTYSPAHDILEDWALTHYVSKVFDDYPSPQELFTKLGNTPAIRRGFRLWVDEKTSININSISELLNIALNESLIEKYWSNEMLVALLKSEKCDVFIKEYKNKLLTNNLILLKKTIHFIRIACKENFYIDGQFQLLTPEGKIWQVIIPLIEGEISILDNIKMSIIGLISDWENAFLFNKLNQKDIMISIRNILIYYINQIEEKKFYSLKYEEESHVFKRIISILYNLAEVSGEYITGLVKRALNYRENSNEHELFLFYNIVIEHCLYGEMPPSKLIKYMPDLITEIAWKEWKIKPEKYTSFENIYGKPVKRPLNHFEIWGIHNEMRFFPAGIYKTPFYIMLMTNPSKAIKFIVDFLNYSVDFYVHSNTSKFKHEFSQIDLELNDGSIIKQWSGEAFWLAYRGLSVTNDLIESLLLSLEKYLLKCASEDSPSVQNFFRLIFEYILKNSNNTMLISVLASVSIAFPQCVGELMLPILRVKDFYLFDLARSSREYSALSPIDNKIPYAQKERHEFNQLPHRTKYARGLMNFILDYQISIKTLNEKIFQVFDVLKSQDDKSDEIWTKTLTEIDIRNYFPKEYDEELGGYPFAVNYDVSLNKYLEDGNKFVKDQEKSLSFAKIIDDAYKTECSIKYSQWLDCYNNYINSKTINKLYDRYATLAVIGLRDFKKNLTKEQNKWCFNLLLQAISEITYREVNQAYLMDYSFNVLEEDIVLSSLHYLLKNTNGKKCKNKLLYLFILLICNISNHNKVKTLTSYMRNIFYNVCPDEFNIILVSLIKYSEFLQENKKEYYNTRMSNIDKLREKEESYIFSLIKSNDLQFNVKSIKIDRFNHHILCRALTIIPYNNISNHYFPFMKEVLEQIIFFLNKEEKHKQGYWSIPNKERLNIEELLLVHSFTADILLSSDIEIAKQIIDILLFIPLSSTNIQEEAKEFVGEILNSIVYKLCDEWNKNPNSSLYTMYFSNFWNLWEYMFNILKNKAIKLFSNKLLLDIPYLCYDIYGKPYKKQCELLKGKKELYGEIVNTFGKGNLLTIIKVFVNIGMPSLFPDCINWIFDIFENSEKETWVLSTDIFITMVKKLFYHYMKDIAENKDLLNKYIGLLDKMIDLGVSEAYFLRENVITFKAVEDVNNNLDINEIID